MSSLTPIAPCCPYDATLRAPIAESIGQRLRAFAFVVVEGLIAWQERAGDRVRLAALDDRQLHDIGLARADLELEVSKPFWQA